MNKTCDYGREIVTFFKSFLLFLQGYISGIILMPFYACFLYGNNGFGNMAYTNDQVRKNLYSP